MELIFLAKGDLNFNSTSTSPSESLPGSPQGSGDPPSPTDSSVFCRQISFSSTGYIDAIQQDPCTFLEETNFYEDDDDSLNDFAFDFSGHLGTSSLHADEIFDGGKIKPLEPPPQKALKNASSSRQKNVLLTKIFSSGWQNETKSLSPALRDSNMVSERVNSKKNTKKSSSLNSTWSSLSWYKKWKPYDLPFFCSASEVHEIANKKSEFYKKSMNEDVKNLRKMKERVVSAYEWHYNMKKAAAVEIKQKTFLPYKQSLMGCMDLDAAILVEPSKVHK